MTMSGQTTESPPSIPASPDVAAAVKRPPPEDDDDFDDAAPTPKRIAPDAASRQQTSLPPQGLRSDQNGRAHTPHFATEVFHRRLQERTPDELVDLVMHMRADFAQQIAGLAAQCDALRYQLAEMKKCVSTYFSAQSAAVDAAAPFLRQHDFSRLVAPPPPAQPPWPAAAAAAHDYAPTFSAPSRSPAVHLPSQPTTPAVLAPAPSLGTPSQASRRASTVSQLVSDTPRSNGSSSAAPPKYQVITGAEGKPPQVVYGNGGNVADLWREYRHGVDGQPSIESLDQIWGPQWRPEPKDRTWYSRRKLVWDKMKEFLHDDLTEEQAVAEVEKIRGGRSINWLMNLLQNNRKEAKRSWREAAATARAAKLASDVSKSALRYAHVPLQAPFPAATQSPQNGITSSRASPGAFAPYTPDSGPRSVHDAPSSPAANITAPRSSQTRH